MNDHEQSFESVYRCFRCQSGCVHLVCGHTMLTLPPKQFLLFADMVSSMRRQLVEGSDFSKAFSQNSDIVM